MSFGKSLVLFCAVTLFIAANGFAQVAATWTGAGDGLTFADAANWDIGIVPINSGGTMYDVTVPSNTAIQVDLAGTGNAIRDLTLGSGSLLTFGLGTDLAVQGTAVIDDARLMAEVGATVVVPVESYTANFNAAAFTADGAATLLDLSTMQTWSQANFGGFVRRSVIATGGATIDLSGLMTITNTSGDDDVEFRTASSGAVLLDSLTTIDGPVSLHIEAPSFTLPALGTTSGGGLSITRSAASNTDLPVLLSNDGGTWNVPVGGSIDAPQLTQLLNTTVNIGNGGSLNAINLVDVSGSTLHLGGGQTYNGGSILAMDNARALLTGGASLAPAATSYVANVGGTVFSADGTGTELDLSSVQTWSQSNFGGFVRRSVVASSQGHIDLSGLVSIDNTSGDDDLEFHTMSGGTIALDNLATVEGPVFFHSDAASLSLPALSAVSGGMSFTRAAGSITTLPSLQTTAGGTWTVPAGGSIEAPALAQLRDTTVTIETGGTLNVPSVIDVSGSIIHLGANQTLTSAPLQQIDNARMHLSGGATLAVADVDYLANFNAVAFSADGVGSQLDLGTIKTWTQNNFGGFVRRSVIASGGGHIDLSGLETILNTSGDDDLFLQAVTGGSIDLSRLATVDGPIVLDVESGGHLTVGSPGTTVGAITIDVQDVGSRLTVTGDLIMSAQTTIAVADTAGLEIAGNFTHAATTESEIELSVASVWMNGSGGQFLEVGSEDLGVNGSATGNFGMGQLQVGDPSEATSVNLLDAQDNGNRSASAESLYLFGLGGPEGLRIAGGSVLVLNNLNVYAFDPVAGQQVHLNSLFGPGDFRIPFDDGFLQLAAGDFFWSNSAGGSFSNSGNWQGGVSPLIADNVAWDLASAGYTVTFGGDVATNSAVVRSDTVTFDLAGHRYKIAGGGVPHGLVLAEATGQSARLSVVEGDLLVNSAMVAEFAGSSGTLILDDATVRVSHAFTLGAGTATVQLLSDAQLRVGKELDLGDHGLIQLAGGTASIGSAEPVASNGTLIVLSDGTLSGRGQVDGDLEVAGLIETTALSTTDHDLISVVGVAQLGGRIDVSLGFVPTLGSELTLLAAAGGVAGQFAEVVGADRVMVDRASVIKYTGMTVALFTTLPGDANLDGVVNGADFLIWNSNKFTSQVGWRNGDFNADGFVDGQDFVIWNGFKFQSLDTTATVPEPAVGILAWMIVGLCWRSPRGTSRAGRND